MSLGPSLEPEAFERWLTPPIAIKKLEPILTDDEAKAEIYRRLCGVEALSIARTANWYKPRDVDVRDYERIGSFLWKVNKEPKSYDLIWKTGTHTLKRPELSATGRDTVYFNVDCFGIRFDPAGIAAIITDSGFDPTAKASSGAAINASRRGARRKDWWEHLWIE
jgi:hypothetical protein